MPPWFYKPLHSGARLSDQEKQELIIFLRPYVRNNSAVDNLDALSRIDATPMKEEVRKVLDRPIPPFAPAVEQK